MATRTYSELTSGDLESYASSRGAGYQVAHRLTTLIQEGLTDRLITALTKDDVHAIGIEFEADSSDDSAPFSNVDGLIGISVMWFLQGASADSISPAVHAFAIEGSDGPEAIDPQITLPGGVSGGANGSLFVCHYTGSEGDIDAGLWKDAVTNESTILSSNFSLASLGTGFVVPFFSTADVWRGFGTTLTVTSSGGGLNVQYTECEYRNFEWLLTQLDLVDEPLSAPPPHPFIKSDEGRMPDWAPEETISGSFDLGAMAIEAEVPDRYGGEPLWYGIDDREEDISQLQADLWEVGFWFTGMGDGFARPFDPDGALPELGTGDATGNFDVETAWAVREFQIYAGMDTVAEVGDAGRDIYADSLDPVANDDTYDGEISGLFDARTAELLQTWVNDGLRCPVVTEGRSGANKETVEAQNFHADIYEGYDASSDRIYLMDLTDEYPLPDEDRRVLEGDTEHGRYVVGDYQTYLRWAGPRSKPPIHVWPEGELVPWQLLRDFEEGDDLEEDQESTYKIVRSVSQVECLGYADSVNSYDNAIASAGPGHWTFTIIPGDEADEPDDDEAMPEGELPPVLAHFSESEPAAFEALFQRFGLELNQNWNNDGGDLFVGQRKYKDTLQIHYPATDDAEPGTERNVIRFRDLEYFSSWHWFYRYLMAGRTNQEYRQNMWDMARVRIRDLLETEFGDVVPEVDLDDGDSRTARVGDVFKSEQAIALLNRWHIRYPGHVAAGNTAGNNLEDVYERAEAAADANLDQDPSDWPETEAVGRTIVDAILEEHPDGTLNEGDATRHEVHTDDDGNVIAEEWEGDDWYIYESGGNRREWEGIAAGTTNESFLRTLSNVLDWPDHASSSDENHTEYADTLYEDLGGLDVDHGSFSFEDGDLPDAPYETELNL